MFCTNCGKQIVDDSVFCEHCGTKTTVKEPVKVDTEITEKEEDVSGKPSDETQGKEIQNIELKKMADHLEFHGYSIEKVDLGNGREWILARHDNIHNQVFLELTPGFVLFRASFSTNKKHSPKMDVSVNEANMHLDFAKLYYEIGEDDLVTIKFEATYVGDYSKGPFARFQDIFHKEVDRLGQLEELKVFLDE